MVLLGEGNSQDAPGKGGALHVSSRAPSTALADVGGREHSLHRADCDVRLAPSALAWVAPSSCETQRATRRAPRRELTADHDC